MEFTPRHLPAEWEERWRREKERWRRAMEEGDEGVADEDKRELRRIAAYNDARIMGLVSCQNQAKEVQHGAEPVKPNAEQQKENMRGGGENWDKEEEGGEEDREEEEEDEVLTFCCQSHPEDVYVALRGFWECSLLTDLTLTLSSSSTEGGERGAATLRVHSPVLAAVSSLVRDALKTRRDDEAESGSWSLSLGPEAELVGLRAVLEFAYSGDAAGLDGGTVAWVWAAANALGVPQVLELCAEENKQQGGEEERRGVREEERRRRAAEQMKASLRCVEELWEEGVGCDVVLDVDGTAFQGQHNFIQISHVWSWACYDHYWQLFDLALVPYAHRVILAASSDYFRAMFTCGMIESRQRHVSLPALPPSELRHLIGYSYRGVLPLGWGRVFEVADAALRLQFGAALALCLDFMRREMTPGSCLDVASFARAYGMADLLVDTDDFVLRNFLDVSASPAFRDLAAERLLAYLSSDALAVPTELCAFRAAASWVQADPERRLAMAPVLMCEVRFSLMTFREFREVRAVALRLECSSIGGGGGGGSPELELYGSALAEFSADLPQARRRVRQPKDALVLVGGDRLSWDGGQRAPSGELWFANALHSGTGLLKHVEWRRLGELSDGPRFRHAVGVVRGRLHVVGGCNFYAPNDIMKSAYSYDPMLDRWRRLADMQESRSSFSVVVCGDDLLYAIGGDRQINTNVASVEVYNQQSDSWSYVRPLEQPLSGQAAAHLASDDILISGGFDCQYRCLASTFLYRPGRGVTRLADMGHERAQHCMEALRDGQGRCRRLYVAGGVRNLRAFYGDQLACEAYDPVADAWSAMAPLPIPHVGAASAILEEKVYLLGGYRQEDYSENGLIHRYDASTGRWQNMGKMPGAVTDVRACLLHLPGHLRQ
ncbi:Kelch-like protein 33 [Merluccius polli]|uniref:Kelch-like protein 33 n=1 Tax=Merluccius polli TaxID=89951 RepID=A0AA47M208_MERPO|nr:Kelch-like protein 33 [Merluccius polli]